MIMRYIDILKSITTCNKTKIGLYIKLQILNVQYPIFAHSLSISLSAGIEYLLLALVDPSV